MSKKPKPKVIAIVGPTASGKSELAVKLAKKFNGEVISADSRQVYRGLNIGTGKITKREMRGIPHHLLDVASPKRTFTVAQFQKLGAAAIKKILAKGKLPIIVGGTGFYVDALLYDYNLPKVLPNKKLRAQLDKLSTLELYTRLRTLDPRRAKTIDRHNKVRLVRALEIVIQTGKPVPQLHAWPYPYSNVLKNIRVKPENILKIGIRQPDEELKRRIHTRLLARLRHGMIAEVRRLKRSVGSERLESLGLEYRYINRYLEGLLSKSQMTEELEKEIWRYAKRQRRWFKRGAETQWAKSRAEATRFVKHFLSRQA